MSIRLLLVEDNPGDALLLKEALAGVPGSHFQVLHALCLEAGLKVAQEKPFDAILLDLSLPDSNGIATLERVNAVSAHLPIIVLTGLDEQETGIEAVRRGAQDYLLKNEANSNLLVRSIHYAIERKTSQQALLRARNELEVKVLERTAELQRLNRVLRMLITCNHALVRITDEATLLQEICQIIVRIGNYRMAWVGFARNDPDKSVVPAAFVGFGEGYLNRAGITWADTERGRGPTGSAIRNGEIRLGNDFLTDPELSPWREAALEHGFRSSIALPLVSAGRTYGALTIYASRPAAFDKETIEVLEQLADDLAFGIIAIRAQADLRRVEREVLEATEREQQRIGRDLHDGIQGGLAAMAMMLGSMKRSLAKSSAAPAELTAEVDWLADTVRNTINQTRGLVRGLCPLELKSEGLMNVLRQLAATTSTLFGIDCQFACEGRVHIEDETVAIQLYRICQEAVSNALKHAKSKRITIILHGGPGGLTLEVGDDGVGLPDNAGYSGGMGLGTMSYRAKLIGATLFVGRGAKGGTIVRCSMSEFR